MSEGTAERPAASARRGSHRAGGALVSVVIVNFNAGDYLAAAVESVLAEAAVRTEVIVVDNHSRDRSLELLRERVPPGRVAILELAKNHGFAYACNLGIARSRGELVFLLNPDCRLRPGALTCLVRALDEAAEIGAVGPLLVNPDGSEQRGGRREIPNPWQIFCVAVGFHRLMPEHPRFRSFNREGTPLPDGPEEVPAISGACMLVRRSAIDAVGQFDDRYFLHFEDLDWCLRCAAAGIGIQFVPAAVVEHTQGVCSASRPLRTELHKHRSLIRFLRKNFTVYYPSSFMAAVGLLVALRFAVVAVRLLLRRRPPRTGAWEQVMEGPRRGPAKGANDPAD